MLISSAASQIGLKNHGAISAAKAGVIGLTKSTAATYANKNIRINAVAPGLVESNLSKALLSSDMARKASETLHALGRVGQPNEIASIISWLIEEEQQWITGQVFTVDGGLSSIKV